MNINNMSYLYELIDEPMDWGKQNWANLNSGKAFLSHQ